MDGYRDRGPGEPELADGTEESGDAYDAHGSFGDNAPGFWVLLVGVHEASRERLSDDCYHGSDAYADKGEACEALGPAAEAGVD